MRIPVHSPWLPDYMDVAQTILILTMAGMQRKGNPSALLVGVQTGTASVENSMEFPQKAKNGTAF